MAKTNTKQDKRQALVIIAVLAVLLLVGIFVTFNAIAQQRQTRYPRMVSVPTVQTNIRDADGTNRPFGVRVVLEMDNNARTVDPRLVQNEVRAAIASFSHEDIAGYDGTDILREAIRERLQETFGFEEGELLGVLFNDIMSDLPLPPDDVDRRGGNIIFDAIFRVRD